MHDTNAAVPVAVLPTEVSEKPVAAAVPVKASVVAEVASSEATPAGNANEVPDTATKVRVGSVPPQATKTAAAEAASTHFTEYTLRSSRYFLR